MSGIYMVITKSFDNYFGIKDKVDYCGMTYSDHIIGIAGICQ